MFTKSYNESLNMLENINSLYACASCRMCFFLFWAL